ncbi:MAG: tyrosine-type recombinase/integrase [Gammaproteobacteria bacterium]|nr:tyrosine-type recombinase/integrase [Gammaproteobacteria bacterium]
MTHSLANFMKSFFSHYLPVQRGLSSNTIASYRDAIRLILCFVAEQIKKSVDALDVEDLTETVVLDFLDFLQQQRGCSPQTRNARLAAIRSLFAFIARTQPELLAQCQQIRAIPLKRTEHVSVDYLEEDELQALMDVLDPDTRTGVRDQALLLLLYNTGARVSEIVTLKLDGLRLNGNAQVNLKGKGDKHRSCPLWPETVSAINDYLKQRNPRQAETQNLFLNANGAPITRFGIRYVIGKYAAMAGEQCPSLKSKTVTPHTLRHTTAMHLLRAGNDINMVSYWLGHADINTTHVYLEIDMEMKRKMIEKTDAPNIREKKPWHEPGILEWLNSLGKRPELCGVNRGVMNKTARVAGVNFT